MNTKGSRQHSPTPPKQKWQNICLALCILLGILASCETEESFYQPRFPANDVPLTRQALFKPENFFAYTDSTLKAVISALRRVEEEKHFTASFLLKYGIEFAAEVCKSFNNSVSKEFAEARKYQP